MLRHSLVLCFTAIALYATGCHKADVKDYVPAEEAARKALSAALDAWKSGKSPDQIGASNPAVNAEDPQWRGGKKLANYEIVGPAPSEDQNLRFSVKLTLAGEAAPKETTYIVVGKDPLWVFSADSYQKTSGTITGM